MNKNEQLKLNDKVRVNSSHKYHPNEIGYYKFSLPSRGLVLSPTPDLEPNEKRLFCVSIKDVEKVEDAINTCNAQDCDCHVCGRKVNPGKERECWWCGVKLQ